MVETFEILRKKLVRIQNDLISLRQTLRGQQDSHKAELTAIYLDLIDHIDRLQESENEELAQASPDQAAIIAQTYLKRKEPLFQLLQKYEIKQIPEPLNQMPEWSVTVSTVPDPELPNHTVVKVLKEGYSQGDRLIRPAQLIRVLN